ncbi:Protein of unknown function [Litoreibacter ascidiaceicola]|uniref:DUF2948 domain-containing protein n=1 Tax=Litoreibacter ascidiaceicola TaxID=1486859 RepID=A0A1M4ZV49_9RHOB|nr:DUF2948 family protein [Litoreibacter ascidiaceicola]SHF21898.1 Protein of unknown function [Litoreibacter ascidiaceicola]
MSRDASFEDGAERPLRLTAEDADDVTVISSLAQDAVFPVSEMAWKPAQRRFAVLLNRFRWEDLPAAERRGRDFERVRAVLAFDDVTKVSSSGLDRSDPEIVLSLLSITWMAGEDGAGRFELTLAGDGAIALEAECVNITLQDVTRPYIAPSRKAPTHPQ